MPITKGKEKEVPCVISGFRHKVAKNSALLSCYTMSTGNLLPMFRDNLSLPSSGFKIDSLSQNVGKKLPLFAA